MRLLLLLLAVLATAHVPAGAASSSAAEGLVAQAESLGLARSPYWFALLHYRPHASGEVRSEILSPEFFLSPDGASNPAAELAATLNALVHPVPDQPDEHAQCRFIARYKWLRKSLDFGALELPQVRCARYAAYSANDRIESLSLIYATGYLSNPASFYGHILLKFNASRAAVASALLDQSVNYGAVIPDGENPFMYVLKGLFGGYEAAFSHQQYFNFDHAYVENELRDMWEYELALTPEEVDRIVAHSWELLGKKYVYYFTKENCAYRMAQLLELVAGEPLLPELPWALPGAVFERVVQLRLNGAPLVRQIRRIPSRQSRFRDRFLALAAEEQAQALSLVRSDLDLDMPAYRKLPEAGRTAVVDMLIDYYEFRSVIDRKDPAVRRAKQKLLIERAALPIQREGADAPRHTEAMAPHKGPLPFMARFGPVSNSRFGGGMKLRVRPANYDSLAIDAGRIPSSVLTMFDLELVHRDSRLQLRRFDLVRVENPSLATTPLPADGGWAWRFAAGFESQDLACSGCTVFRAMAGAGRSVALGRGLVASAMADFSIQNPQENAGTVAITPRIALIASPVRDWKTELALGRQTYFDGARTAHRVVRWENRFGGSRHWDVRLGYEENVAREFFAGLSLYW